jgi:hypothetical protein
MFILMVIGLSYSEELNYSGESYRYAQPSRIILAALRLAVYGKHSIMLNYNNIYQRPIIYCGPAVQVPVRLIIYIIV